MSTDKRVATMDLKGNAYAKVAERLKQFRTDFAKGKIETDSKPLDDGTTEFKAWIWKDKTDLLELMKAGVTDKNTLRSSADADGNSRGKVGGKEKDYEKLQTIAVGRALAMVGYLSSGDIASFEEMEEFNRYKNEQHAQAIQDAIDSMTGSETLDELRQRFAATRMMSEPAVVEAKDKLKAELEKSSSNDQADQNAHDDKSKTASSSAPAANDTGKAKAK